MLASGLCMLICVLLILEWFVNRRKRAKLFWNIPGPPGVLIFGNGLQLVASQVKLFQTLRHLTNTYKNIFRLWVYPYGMINIYNPDDIEVIISSLTFNDKSSLYDFLRPWLSDGLLLSKGTKWQKRRKILTPAFHFNILQHFLTILEENSWKLVQKLNVVGCYKQMLNVNVLMSDVTLNSICDTSMGIKFDEDRSGAGAVYKNAIHEIGKLIIYRASRTWLYFDAFFNLTKEGRSQKEVLNVLHNFSKKVIEERRIDIKKHGYQIPTSNLEEDFKLGPMKRKMAMLDLLLSAEKDGLITENGIQEEVATFMFEGHDTTAAGLTYALLEMANNKHIQDKAVQELRKIFGESTRVATMQDLKNMKYLECCIKETLRLYPPVPIISRNIYEGVTLSGYEIPPGKNTVCHIHIFDLHRRGDLYPEPLIFIPERFFPENSLGRHSFAYIPFSAGPRNCIGQKFAMLEMKSVLSSILRRYELQPVTKPSELEFTVDLVLRTTHPIYVNFVKRV